MDSLTAVNVLLIEDDLADAELVKEFLIKQKTHSYKLDCLKSYDEALKMISSSQIISYDVILIDYFLGKKNGLDLVKEIANKKLGIPIIFLTGNDNVAIDLEAMRRGAADYIVKGKFDADLLDRSIRYSIEHKKNQRLLIKQQQKEAALMKASALADLASFVAHEINNPLSVIQMQAASMDQRLNADQIDIEKMKSQVKKILVMIERILAIKKNLHKYYKNQNPEVKNISEDLNDVIRDSLQLCKEQLSSYKVIAYFEATPAPILLSCQAIELSQVFVNLITNACEAIQDLPERWLKIEIKESGDRLKVFFTDSGNGINKEVADKLFSKYFTTKPQGSGIGLHLSKFIIESYGGVLELDRESPHTKFYIEMPLKPQKLEKKQYRFLVVDDEDDFANVICEHIVQRGYLAQKETNPIIAKGKILNGECDGVLTDLRMVGLSGLELALAVVAESKNPPVFTFMSGYITPALRSLIQEKKLGQIFEKPFNIEEIVISTIEAIESARK